jgi:hypothetical protein
MSNLDIVFRCESGHEQRITYHGMPREMVEFQAGLLDGTSPYYVHPPGPESQIGKCGICGSQVKATVVESATT